MTAIVGQLQVMRLGGEIERAVEPIDDEVLAARAALDLSSFGQLYQRFGRRIYRYIRSQVPDDATAEDLTAHTFYRALSSASTFRGEGSYRAWLYQIARNTIATWRARKGEAGLSLEILDLEPPAADESPLTQALVGEERELVRRTVDSLPEAQREVIRLRYWKELSIDEIATLTRRSSVAVRQLLHRARNRLRGHLSAKDLSALFGATGASAIAAVYTYRKVKRSSK